MRIRPRLCRACDFIDPKASKSLCESRAAELLCDSLRVSLVIVIANGDSGVFIKSGSAEVLCEKSDNKITDITIPDTL